MLNKVTIKNKILKAAGIKQIHIIGCARSGTTMLHYALIAFNNTTLYDNETSVQVHPTVIETLTLFYKNFFKKTSFYITKRDYSWFEKQNIENLAAYTVKYNIFIINIIRDPRDVLSSFHPGSKSVTYVEPWRWEESIAAADNLFSILNEYPNKLSLKYEDILNNPLGTENLLKDKIGFSLMPEVLSWDHLADNLKTAKISGNMAQYMHKIRNFDRKTIGKWKQDDKKVHYLSKLLESQEYGEKIKLFMKKYNYS